MSKVTWTPEQQEVIDSRNCNILVSAAAGSGKTAVLVERIIQRVTEKENPIDIDELLVVTFTNAAAAEMRERVRKALEKALKENPKDEHLKKQVTLIHHAQITTIDSFCLYLIRNFFQEIDLDPSFRVADTSELELLEMDVLKEIFHEEYEAESEAFLSFMKGYSGRTDDKVKNMVLKIYRNSRSHPWPKEWFASCMENYEVDSVEEMLEKPYMQELIRCCRFETEDCVAMAKKARNRAMEIPELEKYVTLFEQDAESLQHICDQADYFAFRDALYGMSWGAAPRGKLPEEVKAEKDYLLGMRKKYKDAFEKIKKKYIPESLEEKLLDLQETRPYVAELVRLARKFSERMAEKKTEKNIVDFSDMEHFAFRILRNEETKEPTDVAKEFRRHFKEIMIDEYQDSNYLQEEILTSIVMEGDQGNYFMVGDVKQSIYRFRQARPDLFMQKYETFQKGDSHNRRIDLGFNFRSRKEVLDVTNAIFDKIMHKDLGNVEYDEAARLNCGAKNYPESTTFEPEILIYDAEQKESPSVSAKEIEAKVVGQHILKLMETGVVTDLDGGFRPIAFRDIVLLMRETKKGGPIFQRVLKDMGIPAVTAASTGYFSAVEVETILNYLRILDNPRQDIPLASVMMSPIYGFTEAEMAEIRIAAEGQMPFYQCVLENVPKSAKIQFFLDKLDFYRDLSVRRPIPELLSVLLQDTGYLNLVTVMPGGEQRRANLEMLLEKAVKYGSSSYHGLFHFVRYIEKMHKYDKDMGEADVLGENTDAVQIMTIHKSKGLEFPVVYVCNMGSAFNKQDEKDKIAIHPEYGIGLSYFDEKKHTKRSTLVRDGLIKHSSLENMGEELRVLYVALTRAKEKLILCGGVKKVEETLVAYQEEQAEGKTSFLSRSHAGCYLDLLMPAVYSYGPRYKVTVVDPETLLQKEFEEEAKEAWTEASIQNLVKQGYGHREKQLLKERFDFVYPYEKDQQIKSKLSVSEIKRESMIFEEGEEENLYPFEEEESYIPSFIEEKEELTGAMYGTVLHRFLQCLEFAAIDGTQPETSLEQEMERMRSTGLMKEEELARLGKASLLKFFATDLFQRMQQAEKNKQLFKEQPFVTGFPAKEIYDTDSEELVLVQGIMDAYFKEGTDVILVDYKTDFLENEAAFIERYETQLNLYEKALKRVTDGKVSAKIIYAFHLGKEIQLPEGNEEP